MQGVSNQQPAERQPGQTQQHAAAAQQGVPLAAPRAPNVNQHTVAQPHTIHTILYKY